MTGAAATGRIVAVLLIVLAAVFLGAEYLVTPWAVAGPSMEPTLLPGDRVLVDRWTYRHRRPRTGEIALVLDPRGIPLIKRVASAADGDGARAGDRIPVIGDNPRRSIDSRQLGPLPRESFRGRVVFRYWPPGRFGIPSRAIGGITPGPSQAPGHPPG